MLFIYYVINISIKHLKSIKDKSIIVFDHYDDNKFKKIIDEFILSSTNDMSLTSAIRNIDFEAAKLGISFYQMIFILIQKESSQNRKKKL